MGTTATEQECQRIAGVVKAGTEKARFLDVLRAAKEAPSTPLRSCGCGRAYVCVSTTDRVLLRHVAAACKALGLLFERKGHYGVGANSIYIGYDNADGRALGRAAAFAAVLNQNGIHCYTDAASD